MLLVAAPGIIATASHMSRSTNPSLTLPPDVAWAVLPSPQTPAFAFANFSIPLSYRDFLLVHPPSMPVLLSADKTLVHLAPTLSQFRKPCCFVCHCISCFSTTAPASMAAKNHPAISLRVSTPSLPLLLSFLLEITDPAALAAPKPHAMSPPSSVWAFVRI